jgi:multidrug resistance efflux pump
VFAGISATVKAATALVFLTLLAVIGVQTWRLDHAQARIEVLGAEKSALQAKLDAQNTAVAALKEDATRRAAAADKAAEIATKTLAKAEAVAKALEAAPAPKNCEQAIAFLVKVAGGAQ